MLVILIFIRYKTAKTLPIYRGYSAKHLFTHRPSTLFLQFYKSNYKHLWYNLEIKEADQGYTTVSSIDFNQLKYSQSITVSVQNIYLLTLYYSIGIETFASLFL